jgi:two-component system, chemotaxis family, chemotaxis protein CheY
MTKNVKIALIGHCGPDSSYLRMVCSQAAKGAQILMADDDSELQDVLAQAPDLLLFNRELGYGFEHKTGVEAIKHLRALNPALRMMLVSNYPDAQAAAVASGALPGFGKREIGSPRVIEVLRSALVAPATSPVNPASSEVIP